MLAIRYGMARGVFSNEAGLDTASIAHTASTNKYAVNQAIFGMLDTIITTIIVCSMTGFTIITGMWTSPEQLNGTTLAAASYNFAIPHGDKIVTGLPLVLCFYHYFELEPLWGERCCIYLRRNGTSTLEVSYPRPYTSSYAAYAGNSANPAHKLNLFSKTKI